MGIYDTRRTNLRAILGNYDKDGDFGEKIGCDSSRLSQLKTGRANIGEAAARQIEKADGKPQGWLDIPTEIQQVNAEYGEIPVDILSEEEKKLLENFRALCPDQRAALKTVSNALAQSAPAKKTG